MKKFIEKYALPTAFTAALALVYLVAIAAEDYPLDLTRPVNEVSHVINTNPFDNSTTATVTLNVFDADMANEGSVSINGNTATNLFTDAPENDEIDINYIFTTPASHWRAGANTLLFKRLDTWGYKINNIDVAFDGNAVSCILPDESRIENCESQKGANGEQPNVLIQWEPPYARENGDILSPSEIKQSKLYFQRIANNAWTEYVTKNANTNNIFVYKAPAQYGVIITTVDIYALEAVGSDKIIFDSDAPTEPPIEPPIDTPPLPPTLIEVPPEGLLIKFIQTGVPQ